MTEVVAEPRETAALPQELGVLWNYPQMVTIARYARSLVIWSELSTRPVDLAISGDSLRGVRVPRPSIGKTVMKYIFNKREDRQCGSLLRMSTMAMRT